MFFVQLSVTDWVQRVADRVVRELATDVGIISERVVADDKGHTLEAGSDNVSHVLVDVVSECE